MCLPAAPLAIASAVVSAAGTLTSGIMANQQGRYEAELERQNADLSREQAADSIKRGQIERRQFYREAGQIKGQQVAAAAANGVDLGYGSALRMQSDTQMLVDEDAASLNDNTDQRTRGYFIEAMNHEGASQAARAQGKGALIGSALQAGGTLMSAFSQLKGLKSKVGASGSGNAFSKDWHVGYLR